MQPAERQAGLEGQRPLNPHDINKDGQFIMTRNIFSPTLAAVAGLAAAMTPALAHADAAAGAAAGKRIYMRCMACHNVKPGAPDKVGPNLSGVVGKKGGLVPSFRYSPAMKQANVTWNETTLDKWLTRPASVVPGTSMVFAGLSKPGDRKAIIAYLKKPVP